MKPVASETSLFLLSSSQKSQPTWPAGSALENLCFASGCCVRSSESELQLNFSFSGSKETLSVWDLSSCFLLFSLSLCSSHGLQLLKVAGREGNLIAIFHEEHSRVLQQLQVFTFFPESLPATKKPFERKTVDRQSARKSLVGLVSRELRGAAPPRGKEWETLQPGPDPTIGVSVFHNKWRIMVAFSPIMGSCICPIFFCFVFETVSRSGVAFATDFSNG